MESAFYKVLQDVSKLKDISVGHGNNIRDLYGSTANAVSKAELMAATTTMKFQNFNATIAASHNAQASYDSNISYQSHDESGMKSPREDRQLRLLSNK